MNADIASLKKSRRSLQRTIRHLDGIKYKTSILKYDADCLRLVLKDLDARYNAEVRKIGQHYTQLELPGIE